MKLPIWLIALLPKSMGDKQIQNIWDHKTDDQILHSFDDATGWIDSSLGIMACSTIDKIAQDCYYRLDVYILPQMRIRNLFKDNQ